MSEYNKHTWVKGETITAEKLNNMERGIEKALSIQSKNQTSRIGEITLEADKWIGSGIIYSQIVTVDGVTPNSQIDITPSVAQLAVFYEKDITFVTENENGIVTVYAIGQKPQNDYTIQVTITEVLL